MLRTLAILLVVLGVSISAIAGARLSPASWETSLSQGRETLGGQPAAPPTSVGPEERLSTWAAANGGLFLAGLGLLVAGAVLGRVAARRGLQDEALAGSERGPADFGLLLAELVDEVSRLSEGMASGEMTRGRLHELRETIERLQADKMDLLIAAGPRLQLRHGSEGFAAIFSPLSAAERKLNRAWAALVDEHWPEAGRAVADAALELETSRKELEARSRAGPRS